MLELLAIAVDVVAAVAWALAAVALYAVALQRGWIRSHAWDREVFLPRFLRVAGYLAPWFIAGERTCKRWGRYFRRCYRAELRRRGR